MAWLDHPHGGGEGRAPIGRTRPLTPWGKPALGIKTRKKKKLGVKSPTIGYRAPKKVRGLHPSGYKEVRITNIQDLKNLNKRRKNF